MGQAAIPIREVARSVESFDGRAAPSRIRLTADKARFVRYVLCEWDGEAGASSNLGPQLAKLAQKPAHAPRRTKADFDEVWAAQCARNARVRASCGGDPYVDHDDADGYAWMRAWWDDSQEIYVPGPKPAARPDEMWPQERWCSKRKEERTSILRAYRSLRLLSVTCPTDCAIIQALYGETPPGLPSAGMWAKDVDAEYRRVCRYAPGSGGSGVRLEETVRVDRAKRIGESAEAARARVVDQQNARSDRLRQIAKECEQLIVAATHAYIAAWVGA